MRCWLIAAVLVIGGCALQRPSPGPVRPDARAALLAADHWQAWGRIAVKSANGGGQGNMEWDQDGQDTRIRLSGPFGLGAYEIRWTPRRLTVIDKKGEVTLDYTGADAAERFLRQQLGWSFPAGSVRYWLLGILDPHYPGRLQVDAQGGLAGLQQNGWQVEYTAFTMENGLWLPRKMKLENDQARVRLIIDRWALPAGSFDSPGKPTQNTAALAG